MTVHVDCVQYLKVPFHGCKAYFSRNRQRRDVRPKATSASASVPATIPMLPIGDAPAASVFGDFIALLNGELTSQDGGEEGGDEAGEGAGDGAAGSSALTGTPTGAGAGSRSAGSGASRLRGRSPVADSDIRKPAVPAPSATEATDCAGGDFQTTATAIPTPGAAASPALTGAGKLPISAPEGNAAACVHAAAASDPSPKATAARDGSSGYHAVSLAHSVSTHSFWGDEDEDRQAAPAGSGIDGLVLVSATAAASSRAE
ncbi:MAG: hypothetical protein BJ554DRAFT_5514 [Olpidium bornovanus]|uniref:Uncharacterized protein n=1 Tax=Olpidium bornovanus TaxID=278681 RepID=A0A8H8DL06_9FUNG|nr:MAG: hypothetical protein BJ554DRAFT_5514 [Olpidium bornovanus]